MNLSDSRDFKCCLPAKRHQLLFSFLQRIKLFVIHIYIYIYIIFWNLGLKMPFPLLCWLSILLGVWGAPLGECRRGWVFFAHAAQEFRFVRGPHYKIALCCLLVRYWYIYIYIYIIFNSHRIVYILGSLNKFPDFFVWALFIDSTHMKP